MRKELDPDKIAQIRAIAKEANIKKVHLWSMRPEMHFLLKFARFQAYGLFFAGLFAFPYAMYSKYQEDPSKLLSIAILSPFAYFIFFTPIYLYRKHTKALLKNIWYNMEAKTFEVTKFTGKQTVSPLPLSQISL